MNSCLINFKEFQNKDANSHQQFNFDTQRKQYLKFIYKKTRILNLNILSFNFWASTYKKRVEMREMNNCISKALWEMCFFKILYNNKYSGLWQPVLPFHSTTEIPIQIVIMNISHQKGSLSNLLTTTTSHENISSSTFLMSSLLHAFTTTIASH